MSSNLNGYRRKSISFKTATVIVIGMHVLGAVGLMQWSKYKSYVAKQQRAKENAEQIAHTTAKDWPTAHLKPTIVAKPQQVLPQKTTTIQKNVFPKNTSDLVNKTTNAVKKTTKEVASQLKPTKLTESLKQEFIKTKEQPSTIIKSTRIVRNSNHEPIEETYERQIVSSRSSDSIIVSPQTVRTFISNGIHYIDMSNLQ
jgi:hypothetical protein